MQEIEKAVEQLRKIQEDISERQKQWEDLKPELQNVLQDLGEKAGLEYEIVITDHIKNWESVSYKLKSSVFSYYIKGNKKQVILKQGGYLVYGLMPSGFIKVGMVFPRIEDIKEKEISFLQFELIKNPDKLNAEKINSHFIKFINELIHWELGDGGEIKERIGFKQTK